MPRNYTTRVSLDDIAEAIKKIEDNRAILLKYEIDYINTRNKEYEKAVQMTDKLGKTYRDLCFQYVREQLENRGSRKK